LASASDIANRTITQYIIAFFARNANGLTIPTRIIASKELTGVHQVTVVGDEVLVAVQGNRAGNPPVFGGLAVYEASQDQAALEIAGSGHRGVAATGLVDVMSRRCGKLYHRRSRGFADEAEKAGTAE
jgi:hypothetical protein